MTTQPTKSRTRKPHICNGPQPPHPKAFVTPSQVLALFELPPTSLSSVYYWLKIGLMPKPERSPSGRITWRYGQLKEHFAAMDIMPRELA